MADILATGRARRQRCPRCGAMNVDDWPLEVDGKIVDGGCTACWEQATSDSWWEAVRQLAAAGLLGDEEE